MLEFIAKKSVQVRFGLGLVIGLSIGTQVCAFTLATETSSSSSVFSQGISGEGDFSSDESSGEAVQDWNWGLGYVFTRVNADSVKDETSEVSGDLGWSNDFGWSATAALLAANTPQEGLQSRGGSMGLGYRWKFAARAESSYQPSLLLRGGAGTRLYTQTFSATAVTRRGRRLTVTGANELRQNHIDVKLIWRPIKRASFSLASTYYSYDRSVSEFLLYLDSPQAVNRGISGLSGMVSSLPANSYTISAAIALSDALDLDLAESLSVYASDQSQSTAFKAVLTYALMDSFRIGLGAEVGSDTAGLLHLAKDF